MAIGSTYVKILLTAFVLAALIGPAAAFDKTDFLDAGDGYMVNNIVIEVQIGINDTDINSSSAIISIWEWKDDKWTQTVSGRKLLAEDTTNFTAADGDYTIKVLSFSSSLRGSMKFELWTNANVTNSGKVSGGHNNTQGSGKPTLTITKTASSQNIAVDDIVTITVEVKNTGQYDALNVTVSDNMTVENFIMVGTITNNTQSQTFNKGESKTVLVYQVKATAPGTYSLGYTTVSAKNNIGNEFTFNNSNTSPVRITVAELAALEVTNRINGTVVDYYTQSKLNGTLVVRNNGTVAAQNIRIDFPLEGNVKISGKDIIESEGKDIILIDQIKPNEEKIIAYSVTATAEGNYSITPEYVYTYNGSQKTGISDQVRFRAVGNSTIATVLNYWFLLLIPVILIVVAGVFLMRRYKEYKY